MARVVVKFWVRMLTSYFTTFKAKLNMWFIAHVGLLIARAYLNDTYSARASEIQRRTAHGEGLLC